MLKARIVELSERDTCASRLWERWLDACNRTHIDEAILLAIVVVMLLGVAWGVLLVLTQAQAIGVAFVPFALGLGKKLKH